MKKLLVLLIIGLFSAGIVNAQSLYSTATHTFGKQQSDKEHLITATSDGVVTFADDAGIKWPYEDYTVANTANTLTAAETGKTISDWGGATTAGGACGGGGSTHTLPTAAPGMEFTFTAAAQCEVCVDVKDSSDTIAYSISGTALAAGDKIVSTSQAGDSVTLFSTVANIWQVKSMHSAWTDGN
jgi:hypothetical protein